MAETKVAGDGMIKLFCVCVNDRSVFSVKIQEDQDVEELKEAIKEKNQHAFAAFDAVQLQLWKVENLKLTMRVHIYTFNGKEVNFNEDAGEEFVAEVLPNEEESEMVVGLPISNYFLKGQDTERRAGFIHVLVKHPHVENITGSNRSKRQKLPFDTPLNPCKDLEKVVPHVQYLGLLATGSNFKEIRERGLYYVDKTKLILDFVEKKIPYKHVFLSRPRRFGKTLVVSVLENLFLGRKALFTGLYAEKNWEWKNKYPVLRFDFSAMNAKIFETELLGKILRLSTDWSFQNKGSTVGLALGDLVTHLHNIYGPCVILIDEYDKPVVDSFNLSSEAKEIGQMARPNMETMKKVFEMIKSLADKIHFSFVTGTSRLTRASMYSGDNERHDISFDKAYDAICGFTESELEAFLIASESDLTKEKLKSMYNGYQFGGDSFIYNPFGVVNAFVNGKIDSYWIESGSLASSVLKFSCLGEILVILRRLDKEKKIVTTKLEVCQNFDVDVLLEKKVPLLNLLLQAGYLTLSIEKEMWWVVIPNDEVRTSAIPELLRLAIAAHPHRNVIGQGISTALHKKNMKLLYDRVYKFLAGIGYPSLSNETYFRSILQAVFRLADGVNCQVEVPCSDGRADLFITTAFFQMVIELKLVDPSTSKKPEKLRETIHKTAMEALEQARRYALGLGATVIAGWVVSTQTRTLFDLNEYGEECQRFEELKENE